MIYIPFNSSEIEIVLDEKLKKTPNPSRDELFKIARKIKPFNTPIKIKTSEFGDELLE